MEEPTVGVVDAGAVEVRGVVRVRYGCERVDYAFSVYLYLVWNLVSVLP